jgi:hypothetical protein
MRLVRREPLLRRVRLASSMILGCELNNHITDVTGKEFTLPSQRQQVVSRLRGRGVGC